MIQETCFLKKRFTKKAPLKAVKYQMKKVIAKQEKTSFEVEPFLVDPLITRLYDKAKAYHVNELNKKLKNDKRVTLLGIEEVAKVFSFNEILEN